MFAPLKTPRRSKWILRSAQNDRPVLCALFGHDAKFPVFQTSRRILALGALALVAPWTSLCHAAAELNLPDPLRFTSGETVKDPAAWARRRAEIIALYEQHVFGRTPGTTTKPIFEVRSEKRDALGGLATRREIRIYLLGDKTGPWCDLLLYVPTGATGRVPAFLGLNFPGNQGVTSEPDIPITPAWVIAFKGVPGIVKNHATDENRAAQSRRWPLELILKRGYAVATAGYAEIEPDRADAWQTNPLRRGLGQPASATERAPDEWGSVGVWAFGLSRALDYLQTTPEIDASRVALTGHSRLGKTALWAGARDQRFALVISSCSGEGGAALARRKLGERISDSIKGSGYWYCPRYKDYVDREETLPVDAHLLLSLIAPRPLYIGSATEDLWADPEGEFLAARHAGPVYALWGFGGVGRETMPPPDTAVGDRIGYHVRTGPHDILAADWKHHLDFADRFLKSP